MNELKNIQNEINMNQTPRDYSVKIAQILGSNLTPKVMGDQILDYHENDIALAMELVGYDERKKLFSVLNADMLARVLEYSEHRSLYLDEMNMRRKIDVLSNFEPFIALEYLKDLGREERKTVFDLMDSDAKIEISLLSSFEEDEIGSRMTTNYITVPKGCNVKEAMNLLVDQAAENDNISTLYVVDSEGLLIGAIDLKELIIARKDKPLCDITVTSYPYVYATEQIDRCIERIKNYSEDSIPVLDDQNKLIGVLILEDILQLVDEEMSDDYAKLAGLSAEEDLSESMKKSIGKRLPWLIVLLGLSLIVSSVVGIFEKVVANLTLIVCFQSLILGMAGNVGTQSLAVTIRVLMDESLSKKQKLFLVGKEARVGFINGTVLGVLSFVFIGFYIVIFKNYSMSYAFSVSLCTGIALMFAIVIASIVGTVIPIAFKGLNIDPAVASGPLITTVNDLVAVVSYYSLAWILLINILRL